MPEPVPEGTLAAARTGDPDAFAALVAPHRAALRAHCYRMLGALPDAEDALQETLLRAWRGLGGFEERSSLRSWLFTIATRTSLRLAEGRPPRIRPTDVVPGSAQEPVPAWLEPYPDADLPDAGGAQGGSPEVRHEERESVELAFTAALQHLPARQRATLILRDVLGFSARETATVLDTTPASVDSTMQRARRTVAQRVPTRSQQTVLRRLGDVAVRDAVDRFTAAWVNHDIDALVGMLADDARLAMPPEPGWFRGPDDVVAFLLERPLAPGHHFRLVPTTASAQPALAAYLRDDASGRYEAESLMVLTLDDDGRVAEITAFRAPGLLARCGLPDHLDDAPG